MANVGKGPAGYPLTGRGTSSPSGATFLPIGSESGLTAHGVVIAEGNGAFVATSAGTAGQVLTSNGAVADPTFQNAASGGPVLIQTINASSSSSIDFTTGITGYGQYEVQWYSVVTSVVTTFQNIQFSTDGGSTWQNTNYNYSSVVAFPNSGGQQGSAGQSSIVICTVTTDSATLPWSGWQRFQNFATTLSKSTYGQNISQFNGCLQFEVSGYWAGAGTVNGIRFIPDTGVYTSGTFKLYGIP